MIERVICALGALIIKVLPKTFVFYFFIFIFLCSSYTGTVVLHSLVCMKDHISVLVEKHKTTYASFPIDSNYSRFKTGPRKHG